MLVESIKYFTLNLYMKICIGLEVSVVVIQRDTYMLN